MKKTLSLTAFVVAVLFAFTAQAGWKNVTGYWVTIDDESGKKKSVVKVYKEDGNLKGDIVKLLDPDGPNPKCDQCSGKRKNQPIEGMTIIWGMVPDKSEGVWQDGTILDPENGKEYSAKLWTTSGGEKLKVRGYVAMFYRTQTWHRTDKPEMDKGGDSETKKKKMGKDEADSDKDKKMQKDEEGADKKKEKKTDDETKDKGSKDK